MSSDEMSELKEHAEEAKHNPALVPVSVTMAALAVLVAVVSLLGHRAHTEEVVLQAKASDQWAFYQAKNIRKHTDDIFAGLSSVIASRDTSALAKLHDKYSQESARYENEQKDVEDEALKLEAEVATERNRANRFDLAEVFLEVGLVITSITLLSGRRIFWVMGCALGIVGLFVAATGFIVH